MYRPSWICCYMKIGWFFNLGPHPIDQLTPPSPVEALGPSSCSSTCDLGNRNRTRRHSRRWEQRKLDHGDRDYSGDNDDQSLLSSQKTFRTSVWGVKCVHFTPVCLSKGPLWVSKNTIVSLSKECLQRRCKGGTSPLAITLLFKPSFTVCTMFGDVAV